jgi:hypothetical protein
MTARLTPEQLAEIEALVGTQTITGGDAARALLAHIRAVEADLAERDALLRDIDRYAREDHMRTPGVTRLARAIARGVALAAKEREAAQAEAVAARDAALDEERAEALACADAMLASERAQIRSAALEEAAALVATLCGNEIARRVRALRRARRAG